MLHTQVGYVNSEWKGREERPRILSGSTRRANTSLQDVEIHDARPLRARGDLDLDTNGFVLVQHPTRFADFRDRERILQTYLPEMCELLRGLTGAQEIFAFDFAPLRSENPDSFLGAYSLYMHCDYADSIQPFLNQKIMRDAGSPLADDAEGWEFAWYNLWRPVDYEVQTRPLTLIDARTVDPSDIIEYYPAEENFASLPVYDDKQRLYYFPRMQTDEVAIFKQADTRRERAQVCPHTSFDDPDAAPHALPRRSIELRLMCAFAG